VFKMDDIVDHRRGGKAIRADYGFVMLRGRTRIPNKTSSQVLATVCTVEGRPQHFMERFKDDVKESTPVVLAEFAVPNKLVKEPAFKWWVPYTLKERDCIIKVVKRRFQRKNEIFRMEIPNLVKRALEIDQETRTDFWQVALAKDMKNIWLVFEFYESGASAPVGSTHIDLMAGYL
jgi:hypothetical protein